MKNGDDFDSYVESLPAVLTLLSEAVEAGHGPTTRFVQELRTALAVALAAAERLRLEHRRKTRQKHSKDKSAIAHLRLVS